MHTYVLCACITQSVIKSTSCLAYLKGFRFHQENSELFK